MKVLNVNELKSLAYVKVKEMILSEELLPGQKIVQDKLARELGISRTPLRGALQILESEHLVESIPRRGVIVREFSDEKVVEIYDCRIALETMAARCFVENSSRSTLLKIKSFFADYEIGDESIDVIKYKEEDTKFHDYIIENCGNEFLVDLFKKGNLLLCIQQIGLIRPPEDTLEEHRKIINAMLKRDVNESEDLIRQHLLNSRNLIKRKIQEDLDK